MKIIITGAPKEIADCVSAIQSQPNKEIEPEPSIDVCIRKVARYGVKLDGNFYEFPDYLFYIGTYVYITGGKVYNYDGKFLGELVKGTQVQP